LMLIVGSDPKSRVSSHPYRIPNRGQVCHRDSEAQRKITEEERGGFLDFQDWRMDRGGK
jgi:hypothetical protein